MFSITSEEKKWILKRRIIVSSAHIDRVAKWMLKNYGQTIHISTVRKELKKNSLYKKNFLALLLNALKDVGVKVSTRPKDRPNV